MDIRIFCGNQVCKNLKEENEEKFLQITELAKKINDDEINIKGLTYNKKENKNNNKKLINNIIKKEEKKNKLNNKKK